MRRRRKMSIDLEFISKRLYCTYKFKNKIIPKFVEENLQNGLIFKRKKTQKGQKTQET